MLELEHIDVFYGAIQALRDITLNVQEKEIYAVIGANGAGKSTLLKTIMGLERPTKGSIRLFDSEITQMPVHLRFKMGISITPEGRELFPYLTVKENLMVGAYNTKEREEIKKRLSEVLELFPPLKGRENQVARTLSGGEQQMVAVGRALMSGPKLLLLDEPSTGLMPILVEQIFNTLEKLRGRTTVLIVEQNAMKALQIADRAAVLQLGRIILEDSAKRLLNEPGVQRAYLGA